MFRAEGRELGDWTGQLCFLLSFADESVTRQAMTPVRYSLLAAIALSLSVAWPTLGQLANQAVSVTNLKSVPDGNYLLTLELEGQTQRVNLRVEDNRAKCVASSDPKLKSLQGRFEPKGDGVFVGFLQGGAFRTSQVWIFRADGAAAVREVPDRGEQQSAVPTKSSSLEIPKKN